MQSVNSAKTQSWLIWFFRGLIVLASFVVLARLAELQIIKGEYYRDLAEGNRLREIRLPAPRGKILARSGQVLVGNVEIQKWLIIDPLKGVTISEVTSQTPEDEKLTAWQRDYKLNSAFAHVGGYLGEVNKDEIGKSDPACLDKGQRVLGQFIGRSGLEQVYDCVLRGVDGQELVEVDAQGNRIRTFGRKPVQVGDDLQTTIDYDLQKFLPNRLAGKKGAIVVSNTKGEILALYSSPSFDPQKISEYINDPDLPLFNRASSGAYHPGSVFKMVTSVAALEEGAIARDYTYEDTGSVTVNEFEYTNWYFTQYGKTEGMIDLSQAIARSTDTFFYEVGGLLGADKLSSWAREFGFGSKTGIDLPSESAGLVPSPEWKKAVKGERWFLGNTFHMAIGQGDLEATVLQANAMTSALATGQLCQLHLTEAEPQCQTLSVSKQTLTDIKIGMQKACQEGGTAYPFFGFSPDVACKTGTAETWNDEQTHAWFTVYGPVTDPEIVVTVLVENGGEGSEVAAPIAREIFDWWFHL